MPWCRNAGMPDPNKFAETKVLERYDPFASQKIDEFQKIRNGVYRLFLLCRARTAPPTSRAELASSMYEIEIEKDKIQSSRFLSKETIRTCRWHVSAFPPVGCSQHSAKNL